MSTEAPTKKTPWGIIIFGCVLVLVSIVGYIWFSNRKFLSTPPVDASTPKKGATLVAVPVKLPLSDINVTPRK